MMSSYKYKAVVISHPLLDSKNATFVALLNEVIKWGSDNGITGEAMYHLQAGFSHPSRPNNDTKLNDLVATESGSDDGSSNPPKVAPTQSAEQNALK